MVVNGVRDRYRVDLIGLQAACEANYARLCVCCPKCASNPARARLP